MARKSATPQLTQDHTELIVLSVLSEGPSYGYSISKQIAARSEDEFRVGASQLYPLLTKMEKQGLVETDWEEIKSKSADPDSPGRKRKWYRLSVKGERRLQQRIEAHKRFTSLINSFIATDPAAGAVA
ncbi:MAG: PadR family transcriptional regulator [Phycisphaerales bacterium]